MTYAQTLLQILNRNADCGVMAAFHMTFQPFQQLPKPNFYKKRNTKGPAAAPPGHIHAIKHDQMILPKQADEYQAIADIGMTAL